MRIYNTLTKKEEEFVPREDKKVKMFVCGPTVYDLIHIGNARTFTVFDIVAKYLRYKGFEVEYIQNITDIDDKIIQRAKENNIPPLEWAKRYEDEFLKDIESLGIDSVSKFAKATDHIEEVKKQVKVLKEKNHAYLIENDGWYFDLSSFPQYGKLSNRTSEMADDAVSRIDESEKKKNRGDFALWKLSKPGEPSWPDEELGEGRPGWHIEDTAITEHYFGPQYDLHGGGQDLIFPHHEAEIAQQESASGKEPFVKYWMHAAFLVNQNERMGKSKGNFTTARELIKKYPAQALRFYIASGHYRKPLDFSEKNLNQALAGSQRLAEFTRNLTHTQGSDTQGIYEFIAEAKTAFIDAMDNDFNTPSAIAAVFDLVKKINPLLTSGMVSTDNAQGILGFLNEVDSVLGIISSGEIEIPSEVSELVSQREELRKDKNFEGADKIRAQINEMGFEIEDTMYGPVVIHRD